MIWSMIANVGAYVGVSLSASPSADEHRQASVFVDVFRHTGEGGGARFWRGTASVPDLYSLLARFLGTATADSAFADYASARGLAWPDPALVADAELVHYVEVQLAGAIGGASARIMVASVVKEETLTIDEVRDILDEASQVVVYSHRLELKSRELEAATAELREANERLKELDRLKDDFVSTVTHELRTPLTSIRAFTEILLDDPEVELGQRKKFLGIITKETERLTRLINQVLDLAKIESGKAEWIETSVDLKDVISDTLGAMGQVFKEKRIEVTARLPDKVSPVTADLDRMIQVMLNLLSNAAKFCDPANGRVEIALVERNGSLQVDVRDNGRGISPEHQAEIFSKFHQVGDTLTDKPHGSGLGLHISRQIIEHFGGRLWVESDLGRGACFSFTVPTGASARAALHARPTPEGRAMTQEDPDRRRRAEHRRGDRVPVAAARPRSAHGAGRRRGAARGRARRSGSRAARRDDAAGERLRSLPDHQAAPRMAPHQDHHAVREGTRFGGRERATRWARTSMSPSPSRHAT